MRIPIIHAIAVVTLSVTITTAIPPPRLPLHKPIHEEPDYLTDYERKILKIELGNLTSEITKARNEAAKDPSLEAAQQSLDEALKLKDANQITSARRTLADQVETLLLSREGMPEKIKRLLEVGRLLEYDTQREKDDRRRKGTLYKRLRNQPHTPSSSPSAPLTVEPPPTSAASPDS